MRNVKEGICFTGVPSTEELFMAPGVPSDERITYGRVACIECVQDIPCNPCEAACKFGAITIGDEITALPYLDEKKCTGCGQCIYRCPGLAITVLNGAYSETEATVDFPFEYLPLPVAGDIVDAVNRCGVTVCQGIVRKVMQVKDADGTTVISIIIPKQFVSEVRSMKRLGKES